MSEETIRKNIRERLAAVSDEAAENQRVMVELRERMEACLALAVRELTKVDDRAKRLKEVTLSELKKMYSEKGKSAKAMVEDRARRSLVEEEGAKDLLISRSEELVSRVRRLEKEVLGRFGVSGETSRGILSEAMLEWQ